MMRAGCCGKLQGYDIKQRVCLVRCRTLEVLQDRVEPRPFAEVELAVQRELGAPIAELFAEFEPEARAAASLAQVCGRRMHSLLSAMACSSCMHQAGQGRKHGSTQNGP